MVVLAVVAVSAALPVHVQSVSQEPVLRAANLSLPGLPATVPEQFAVATLEPAPVPLTVVAPPVAADDLLIAIDSTEQALTALQEEQDGASQEASEDEVDAERASEQLPLFYQYEIQPGDTVGTIAQRFGIGTDYILWNNIDIISDQDLLSVGEQLQIPSVEGIIHSVRVGETLTEIADQYDADAGEVIAFAANELPDHNLLREGIMILVPGGRVVPKPAPELRPETPSEQFVDRSPSESGFIWPIVNLITSLFDAAHPLGIDINAPFLPVAASAAGQVVFVGGDECCSYGHYIEIRHDGGYATRYAHLSAFAVELGQWVEQGQIIGTSGNTGRSTGPHLHFEILRDGVHLNPLLLLP